MNRFPLIALIALASATLTLTVRSQAPAPAKTPIEALQLLKAQNAKLLEQQNATLQKLEALQKEAHQLRILARRT